MLIHELALLVAVVTPVVVIIAIDVYLALHGETETLLIPRVLRYPALELDPEAAPAPAVEADAAETSDPRQPLSKAS